MKFSSNFLTPGTKENQRPNSLPIPVDFQQALAAAGGPPMIEVQADPKSLNPPPDYVLAGKYGLLNVARVSYSKKIKRITLQRYLCGKIVFQERMVTYLEILVLYDNLLWCQDKAERDPGFQNKFGKDLKILTELLKSTRFSSSSFPTTLKKLSEKMKIALSDFYYPQRNLSGVERHLKGGFQVLPHRESGTERNQLPSKRYIGVGYKDKGNRRDPAHDGSPSWQEVASKGNQDEKRR